MFIFIQIVSALLTVGLIAGVITRNCVFERTSIAPADGVKSGTVEAYGNRFWVSQGLKDATAGDPVNWRSDLVVEAEKTDAATAIDDGADVRFDMATQKVVAAGGVVIGSARRGGSPAGSATVFIAMNQQA